MKFRFINKYIFKIIKIILKDIDNMIFFGINIDAIMTVKYMIKIFKLSEINNILKKLSLPL